MTTSVSSWPQRGLTRYVYENGDRYYQFPDGRRMVGVTSVLKTVSVGKTEPLMWWAAKQERLLGDPSVPDDQWKPAYQRTFEEAGDLGTAVHKAIETGGSADPEIQRMCDQWGEKRDQLGLVTVRAEQLVYDADMMVAGTADSIADSPAGLTLVDFKTSKAVYLEHQIQAAEYLRLARRFAPVERALIVRLPKIRGDHVEIVPVENPERLQAMFAHIWAVWKLLKSKEN